MTVFINSEKHVVNTGSALGSVLEKLNLTGQNGIAVAVNNEVVPKLSWEEFQLQENDKVLLIKATQGG